MLFDAALFGVLVGLLAGGSCKRILEMPLKMLPLLAGAVLLSLLPRIGFAEAALSRLGTPGAVCFAVLRYGLLLAFAAVNRRCIPVDIIGAGGALNLLVTLANGGRMPVVSAAIAKSPQYAENILLKNGEVLIYTLANAHTRLFFLCDRLEIPFYDWTLRRVRYFLSAGDILVAAGVFLLMAALMKPTRIQTALSALARLRQGSRGRLPGIRRRGNKRPF